MAYCRQAAYRLVPAEQAYSHARAAALRALAMDASSADALVALGEVLFFGEWHWAGAERSFERALQINPNHSEAYLLYGQLLEAVGKLEQGLEMKLRAFERDPHSPMVHLQVSVSYWHQRRYDDAIDWAKKTLELDPRHPHAREHLAGAYWKKGDDEKFIAENLKHAELHGAPREALERLKQLFAAEGMAGFRRGMHARASKDPQAFPPMWLALAYGGVGDFDKAFEFLDKAIEGRDSTLVHLAVAPQWDCLRGDSRFADRLSRMGLGGFQAPAT
jgi:tetratricopeptide (TPR) repeat protein